MNELMYYLGIILLLLSILYTGRQVNIYLRMKRHIGKRLSPLTPGRTGIRRLKITGIAFVALLVVVTLQYVTNGYDLSASYSIVLSVVIFSCGRFFVKMSEIREDGIMGNLEPIPYLSIKSHNTEETGGKTLIKFLLRDGREYVAAVLDKDKNEVLEFLDQKI